MRAVVVERTGGPEVLQVRDQLDPVTDLCGARPGGNPPDGRSTERFRRLAGRALGLVPR